MFKENLVTCEQGILRGAAPEGGVTVFRGVPFAEPPVGDLRWRAARKPARWYGVRPATEFMAMPRQVASINEEFKKYYQSEDCLYLNIWTPAESGEERLPVYVWFYGGSYQAGNAAEPIWDGSNFARHGIVAVTVNYRVGLFGFLCHPEMAALDAREHGNFGLTDQIAALEWLRDNIAFFGGDPEKMTIGGHSAGSASVNNLMVSPLSRGLIRGAINESGDVLQPERDITFEQACAGGMKLQELVGAKTLDGMRALPADVFQRPDFDLAVENRVMCTPVIDGTVIPYAQGQMLLHGDAAQIPILIGTCLDEGSGGGPGYRERILERFSLPEEMYPADAVRTLARDYWYARHVGWVHIREEQKLPTWHYSFARRVNPLGAPNGGAQHGMELPYAFASLGLVPDIGYTADDYRLKDVVSGYWINFIKTGDPNGEGLAPWPQKTGEPVHLRFDVECGMEPDCYLPAHEVICPAVEAWLRDRAAQR